jgi:Zn-dependent peptidase ImmA (M78 family)
MPDSEAKFDPVERLLYLRESTFCAANAMYSFSESHRKRARFTIAHEIGHIALKHQGTHYRGRINDRLRAFAGRAQQNEREAEKFAAAFLAPAHLALDDVE